MVPGAPGGRFMSVFRTAMVWLGLVDDDEYDGEDEQYYLDEEYDDPADLAPAAASPRVATRPAVAETSQVAVFRGRHARPEAEAPVATVTRPSSALNAVPV